MLARVCPPHRRPSRLLTRRAFSLLIAVVLLVTGGATRCPAADQPPDAESLRGFMVGDYDLIGRRPDSAKTYTGRITLRLVGEALQATRTIGGVISQAVLRFDTIAGADRIPVLRMRFTLGGVTHEAIYQWRSDPDNYPRFTGLVYRPGNQTKRPGLEAWFPIQPR